VTAAERASRVRLLLFDVDGVLTDGTTLVDAGGNESLRFDIRDGLGLVCAQRAGLVIGLVSARAPAPVAHRAAQLGIRHVALGVDDKLAAVARLAGAEQAGLDEVAFMGDDLVDLPVMARVGLAIAPADAAHEVRERAHVCTTARGGRGAVREAVEFVLRAQDRWAAVVGGYAGAGR
jgi:3-deoxy-D-manno-octulosonate 8-phosphate phosphatase (KDO 8-P phosphatase)